MWRSAGGAKDLDYNISRQHTTKLRVAPRRHMVHHGPPPGHRPQPEPAGRGHDALDRHHHPRRALVFRGFRAGRLDEERRGRGGGARWRCLAVGVPPVFEFEVLFVALCEGLRVDLPPAGVVGLGLRREDEREASGATVVS